MSDLIILGAGGHARVLVEALRACGSSIKGFVSNDEEIASGNMAGLPRLASDKEFMARGPRGVMLVNGLGSTKDVARRRALYEMYRDTGFSFAPVIHPSAIIAADVAIGDGAQVLAGCILQPSVRIGANCIVNTGAIVDHDTVVCDHVHIAPGATLSGNILVGRSTHIGTGAVVIQGICIGEGALVAAGAVVTSNVAAAATVMGVPARTRAFH